MAKTDDKLSKVPCFLSMELKTIFDTSHQIHPQHPHQTTPLNPKTIPKSPITQPP